MALQEVLGKDKSRKNYTHPDCINCGLPRRIEEQKKEMQLLAQNLLKLQEDKCKWVCNEMHDELGQWLTAINAEAVALSSNKKQQSDTNARQGIQSIKDSVKSMHDVLHNLLHELRPTLLDKAGLSVSLHDLKDRWCTHHPDIYCKLVLEGELDKFVEMTNITIYRVIQEALNNIASHAKATRVLVYLTTQKVDVNTGDNILVLEIQDNGKGYDSAKDTDGFGILGMRERINAAGGEFSINGKLGHGTQIVCSFPILEAAYA